MRSSKPQNYREFTAQLPLSILGGTARQAASPLFENAVVIGGGIAGLTAARVLSDYFNRVTLIERDRRPSIVDYRPGVPQARHAHTLLPGGQKILEQLFPGLVNALLAQGAISIHNSNEIAFFHAGRWRSPRQMASETSISSSQPLLETTLYRYLEAYPNIQIIEGHETIGLITDNSSQRVEGVRLRSRGGAPNHFKEEAADLVVDTSGRNSRAPVWLEYLGYSAPQELVVNASTGYATQIYQRPIDINAGWKKLYIRPAAPRATRGGIIIPMEGNRWCVTLIGMAGDYPPIDSQEFLAFAKSLESPVLYQAIEQAEPLTKPIGYRRTENRWRQYDKLPRYLEGFLVMGDAVYSLNPIYAQGMTTAATGSQVLNECLRKQKAMKGMGGLAQNFQQSLAQSMALYWRQATMKDREWPGTAVVDSGLIRTGSFSATTYPMAAAYG